MPTIHIVNLFIKHKSENKVLVVKRAHADKTFADMYALPGGKIEKGETIREAAERELLEETGVELKSISLGSFLTSPLEIQGKVYIIGLFTAEITSDKFAPRDKDIVGVEYIKPEFLIKSLKKHKYPLEEIKKLEAYFVENKLMTPAFERIREIVAQIPEGKVATYGQIAQLAGLKDVRKVAWAIKNDTALGIPTHRVVKKDGELVGIKEQLAKEGVSFSDATHVNLAKHQWSLSS